MGTAATRSGGSSAERRLLALAEDHFNKGHLPDALRAYQRLASITGSPLVPYAQYRIGWCQLNLQRFRLALAAFVTVLRNPRSRVNLRAATRQDLVRVYLSVGRPSKAYNFFFAVSRNAQHAQKMLRRLGNLYLAQGHLANAEKIFVEHLRRWPKNRARCTWAESIVKARIRLGRKQPTLEALKLMVKILTALRGRYGAKSFAVVSCRKTIRGLLGGLARRWRVEAHVTKNRTTAALAQRAEQLYMKVFRSSP
jgi:tetratricopeptide (TPR) repeat protein